METATVHNSFKEFLDHVYNPSEDTFLLIDAIESDLEKIKSQKPLICLEVGSGSGICISTVGKAIGSGCFYLATDINFHAAILTQRTARQNGILVEVVSADLTETVISRLNGSVDLLIFNPPYVVTPSNEIGCRDLSASWAGGVKGREVTNRFLPEAVSLLSPRGLFYLVVLKENDPDDIKTVLEGYGMQTECVMSRRCGSEQLFILRSQHSQTT